jgi:hypothetical protein
MSKREPVEDEGRQAVKSFLEAMGFDPETIPEAATKTPDLSLRIDSDRFLIEVKLKVDDDHLRRIVNAEPGSTHSYDNPSIQSRLREGRKQLSAFPERCNDDFLLVWMLGANTGLTALVRPAAVSELYGSALLEGFFEDTKKAYSRPCYFLANSWFFRNRDLDAVILQDFQGVKFCLNPFSPRYALLKMTRFADVFRQSGCLTDPRDDEADGKCFIADCDIPRRNISDVIAYLIKKYGLAPPVNIVQFSLMNCPV